MTITKKSKKADFFGFGAMACNAIECSFCRKWHLAIWGYVNQVQFDPVVAAKGFLYISYTFLVQQAHPADTGWSAAANVKCERFVHLLYTNEEFVVHL